MPIQTCRSPFKCDYKTAIINAVLSVFPDTKVTGFYHHFNDAVWKQSKKIGLDQTRKGRNTTRKCAMIPLLPANYIPAAWRFIVDEAPESEEIRRFRRYFKKQWYLP